MSEEEGTLKVEGKKKYKTNKLTNCKVGLRRTQLISYQNKIYLFGGYSEKHQKSLNELYEYDPEKE